MTPITLWYRKDRDGRLEYNHLSDGHSEAEAPVPNCDFQKRAWSGAEWVRKHGQLVDGRVVE